MVAGLWQIPLVSTFLQFITITFGIAVCVEIMPVTNRAFVKLHMEIICSYPTRKMLKGIKPTKN